MNSSENIWLVTLIDGKVIEEWIDESLGTTPKVDLGEQTVKVRQTI